MTARLSNYFCIILTALFLAVILSSASDAAETEVTPNKPLVEASKTAENELAANATVDQEMRLAAPYRIGILSKRGPLIVQKRWSEMASYLQQKIPQQRFTIVPLSFDAVRPAVQNKQIDFLLTNSGMFVDLSFSYKLFAIATVKRKILKQAFTEFGSVVFTRSERDGVKQLSDLSDLDIAAVDERSLGGWIAALRELDSINFEMDSLHSLDFLGTHDAVVLAVENRTVDVGIVRTDTLEHMAAEGIIDLSTFKAIPRQNTPDGSTQSNEEYPLLLTTRLYPEWPIASLAHVPDSLTEKVSSALLLMPADSPAAINAQIMGWTIPKNYREVDLAYSQLGLGFYKSLKNRSVVDIFTRYWKILLAGLVSLIFSVQLLRVFLSLRKQLKSSQAELLMMRCQDPITGLANRSAFFEQASRHLHFALKEKRQCALLLINLSGLDRVHQQYGYEVGEQTLLKISQRLESQLADGDIVGKSSGNQFFILLSNSEILTSIESYLQQLIDSIQSPFTSEDGSYIEVGCHIGVSRYPTQATVLKPLIKKANIALEIASQHERSGFNIFAN